MCQLYISIKKIKIMIDSLLSNGKKSPLTLKLKNSGEILWNYSCWGKKSEQEESIP